MASPGSNCLWYLQQYLWCRSGSSTWEKQSPSLCCSFLWEGKECLESWFGYATKSERGYLRSTQSQWQRRFSAICVRPYYNSTYLPQSKGSISVNYGCEKRLINERLVCIVKIIQGYIDSGVGILHVAQVSRSTVEFSAFGSQLWPHGSTRVTSMRNPHLPHSFCLKWHISWIFARGV